MKLYIANATRQNLEFRYRLPERASPYVQMIPIGGQVMIAGADLTQSDIDAVVNHHRVYGLISADEMDRGKGPFSGTVYSIDRPVSEDRIRRAMNRTTETLVERGEQIRRESAIAIDKMIKDQLVDNNIDSGVNTLEMSVIEEESRTNRDTDRFAEGLRVSQKGLAEGQDASAPVAKTGKRRKG